jgi:hypothetical protein
MSSSIPFIRSNQIIGRSDKLVIEVATTIVSVLVSTNLPKATTAVSPLVFADPLSHIKVNPTDFFASQSRTDARDWYEQANRARANTPMTPDSTDWLRQLREEQSE